MYIQLTKKGGLFSLAFSQGTFEQFLLLSPLKRSEISLEKWRLDLPTLFQAFVSSSLRSSEGIEDKGKEKRRGSEILTLRPKMEILVMMMWSCRQVKSEERPLFVLLQGSICFWSMGSLFSRHPQWLKISRMPLMKNPQTFGPSRFARLFFHPNFLVCFFHSPNLMLVIY